MNTFQRKDCNNSKEKLKHLPFNLFYSLSYGLTLFVVLGMLFPKDTIEVLILSIVLYIKDVLMGANMDYLLEQEKIRNGKN